ncbi:MAG: DUF2459 domain-containing protein [Rubrivivax sp.]|nr:DUF2459 domain-containing protein [Rubrivivax sp.]
MRFELLLLLAAILLGTGCATPAHQGVAAPAPQAAAHRIHVVSHGWHSGIVVRAADVPADAWPARRDFDAAEYLEVGWGHREYYPARDPSVWLGLRALMWPSPGVLHMVAFSGPVERTFAAAEVVALQITPQGLARLVAAIAASHERDTAGREIPLGPGLYGTSRFYASREMFHLFATCNVWAAAMLREAGVPLRPLLTLTSGGLFAQLRRLPSARSDGPKSGWPAPGAGAVAPWAVGAANIDLAQSGQRGDGYLEPGD